MPPVLEVPVGQPVVAVASKSGPDPSCRHDRRVERAHLAVAAKSGVGVVRGRHEEVGVVRGRHEEVAAARIARARKAAEVDSGALRCDGAVEQARVGVALVDIVGRGRDGVAVAATGLAQEVVDERHRRRRRRRR